MVEHFKTRVVTIISAWYFPFIVLAILPVAMFWKASIGTDIFAVGDFSGSDLLELHLPFKQILHDSYTHFEFPLWTPYLSNGFPILAEGQSGPLYPINILLAFLPAYLGLNYSIILCFIVAGWGTYLYTRTLPATTKFSALTTAILFMFSSFFIARVKHLNMIVVASWFPLGLYCIRQFFITSRFKWFLYLGILCGLQLLAGHPHMFYLCVIMYTWYAMGEIGHEVVIKRMLQKDGNPWKYIASLVGFSVALLLAIGIAAAQLIPTYELTRLSARQSFNYGVAVDFPLRPHYLVSLFAPFFLGNPASGTYKGDIHTDGIWWENVVYIGLLPFALIIVVLFFFIYRLLQQFFRAASRKRRVPVTTVYVRDAYGNYSFSYRYFFVYFLLTTVLFYILAMGSISPLFDVLYFFLPGMQLFRFPNRFTLFSIFSLCLFAGWGCAKAVQKLVISRDTAMKNKMVSDSEYSFSWPFSRFVTSVLFLGLILVDLGVFAYQYIGFYPVNQYLARPKSLDLLARDKSLYRIYSTTQYAQNPFGALGWIKGKDAINSLQVAIPGNFSAYYHLYSFTDRGWFEGGLGVTDRFFMENMFMKNELPSRIVSSFLGLWNVKYFISYSEIPEEGGEFTNIAEYKLDKAFDTPVYFYSNNVVLPRAYLVQNIKKVKNLEEESTDLLLSTSSAQRAAYTRENIETNNEELAIDEFKEDNHVAIRGYAPTRVEMTTDTKIASILLFSDTYYPGWKAYIDGVENPIIKANIIQRALKIPAGKHNIIWQYSPYSFYIGLGISFATCATIGSLLVFGKGKKGRVKWGKEVH